VAAVQPPEIILSALSKALADPTPRPLHGTKAKPGIFTGKAQSTLQAADMAQKEGWIERTGEHRGKGKSRVVLWRVTPAGVAHALSGAAVPGLLTEMVEALKDQAHGLDVLGDKVDRSRQALAKQREAVETLRRRIAPPDVDAIVRRFAAAVPKKGSSEASAAAEAPAAWVDAVEAHLEERQRAGVSGVALSDLYKAVGKPRDLTIGAFHDGLRSLVKANRIRLRPWTQPLYKLQNEQYALMWAQEIMFYAERA